MFNVPQHLHPEHSVTIGEAQDAAVELEVAENILEYTNPLYEEYGILRVTKFIISVLQEKVEDEELWGIVSGLAIDKLY